MGRIYGVAIRNLRNGIPADSRLASAIMDTVKWCSESTDYLAMRQLILDEWGNENFTDCVMNIPFAVMALILGRGDFGRSICLSVNCGLDADCTTATVGAILGIIDPDCIRENWLKPIGRKPSYSLRRTTFPCGTRGDVFTFNRPAVVLVAEKPD